MKSTWLVLMCLFCARPCFAQDPVVSPLPLAVDSAERQQGSPKGETREGDVSTPVKTDLALRRKYVWSTLGFEGALSATIGSAINQRRASPPEWGLDATGYARRWTSQYAETAIGDTTKYAVARLFHHDPSFTRCECSGFMRRLLHAVDSPFTARRRDGTRVPSIAALAGFLAGNVVSASTWYPAPLGARDGLKHAGASLAAKLGADVFNEFRPRRLK